MTTSTATIAWWLLPVILASALLHIQAEYAGLRQRVYVFKPLTTSLIILFALLITPPIMPVYKALIVAGLLFSLGGDVFLMLPNDRFVFGLLSFLIAHLLYIAAFVSRGGFHADSVGLAVYALYGAVMLALLWRGLGSLRIPVVVYMTVILVMGWQAFALWRAMPGWGTACAAIGAALFVVSDSVLAYDRFRTKLAVGRALVLSTYFTAQTLLALSAAG